MDRRRFCPIIAATLLFGMFMRYADAVRAAELLLLSLPVLLLAAWFAGLRRAGLRVLVAAAVGLAVLGGGLWWFGAQRDFTGRYIPARLQNGRIVR
jgi:hypothetical protein